MKPWEIEGRALFNRDCGSCCNLWIDAPTGIGRSHTVVGIQIDIGHHGTTRLSGLRMAATFAWPGSAHEGNGEFLALVDARADRRQRDALLAIMMGKDTAPFATMFAVYAATVSRVHPPQFVDLDIDIDVDARKGHVFAQGYIDAIGEPLRSRFCGASVRLQIVSPDGFEFAMAELGSATVRANGPIELEIVNGCAQFARLHLNNFGVMRRGRYKHVSSKR